MEWNRHAKIRSWSCLGVDVDVRSRLAVIVEAVIEGHVDGQPPTVTIPKNLGTVDGIGRRKSSGVPPSQAVLYPSIVVQAANELESWL